MKLSLYSLCSRQCVILFSWVISINSRSNFVKLDTNPLPRPPFSKVKLWDLEKASLRVKVAQVEPGFKTSAFEFSLQSAVRLCCLAAAQLAGFSCFPGCGSTLFLSARAVGILHLVETGKAHRELDEMRSWWSLQATSKGGELDWAKRSSIAK